ncbi:MAG: hypothetical protein ACRDGA_01975 [Bacteroidota bacterium]
METFDTRKITLKKANRPPLIDSVRTSTGDDFFAVGTSVTLEGYYHDEDDDVVSAEWEEESPPVATRITGTETVSNSTMALSNLKTKTVTITKLGENRFTFRVIDAAGNEVAKELVIEGVAPCLDLLSFEVDPFRFDDNPECGGKPTALGIAVDKEPPTATMAACLDPVLDKWRLQLTRVFMALYYGICHGNTSAQWISLVSGITQQAQACSVAAAFEKTAEGLRRSIELEAPGLAVVVKDFASEEATFEHERLHANRLRSYAEDAAGAIRGDVRNATLSKKEARTAEEAAMKLVKQQKDIQDKLSQEYAKLKESRKNRDEIDARKVQFLTLQNQIDQLREICPQ